MPEQTMTATPTAFAPAPRATKETLASHASADISVTIVLPSGGSRTAEVPTDVPIRELVPELTTKLELPTTGPDGRPMHYRLDSKALGRELKEDETLAAAGVPEGDRLMMTADVTAG